MDVLLFRQQVCSVVLSQQFRVCALVQMVAVVTGPELEAMKEAESVIKNFGSRIRVVSHLLPSSCAHLPGLWNTLRCAARRSWSPICASGDPSATEQRARAK